MIEIKRLESGDPMRFEVIVCEGGNSSRHEVTLAQSTYTKLTGGQHTAEHCLEAAFLFLLDREPKESILSHFDVTTISRYFPEFEKELGKYLLKTG